MLSHSTCKQTHTHTHTHTDSLLKWLDYSQLMRFMLRKTLKHTTVKRHEMRRVHARVCVCVCVCVKESETKVKQAVKYR